MGIRSKARCCYIWPMADENTDLKQEIDMQDESQGLPLDRQVGYPLGKDAGNGQVVAQKLSVVEKVGYSMADAAANFVFMTMILFQTNFYTDVFGLAAGTAAAILLGARLWDAIVDPIVGVLADRTRTRWGKFRPWILFTALPWCVVMIIAYTTPKGWSTGQMVMYAAITNILLMSIYSMNNMPYAALGGVMTADVNERAKLNSYRFVAVNVAQFIVGGFTLPLVAKFAIGHDRQYGWQMTMTIWAVVCLFLFLITFLTTRERIQPPPQQKSDVRMDFAALFRNSPWLVMFIMTLFHFCILSFRGGAWYNYFHYYADKAAMYDWLQGLGLTASALVPGAAAPGGFLETLGYIVHGNRSDLTGSNVADVFNDDPGHPDVPRPGQTIRQEGRRRRRLRTQHRRFRRFLSARADRRRWDDPYVGHHLDVLRSDDPPDLGHLCRCCRLLGMEDRPPFHRNRLCHNLLCTESGTGLGVFFFPVDHERVLRL
jgi:hypothetical protein